MKYYKEQIVSPKLANGVYFTASHVLVFAGQGSIYIQPESDISTALYHDIDIPPQGPDL